MHINFVMALRKFAAPALAAVCALICPGPAAAHPPAGTETWTEVKAPHFSVYTNASPRDGQGVAAQFEQIRAVILSLLKPPRADTGEPISILALKNEASFIGLLPEFYEKKGSIHPGGLFASAADRNYVALRLDAPSDANYQVLYHEYTHLLLRLNYGNLPLWLSEGLAELYGHTYIGEKEVIVGEPSRTHLLLLRESRLLPLEALFAAGHDSPLANEQNKASMFYAEAWAVVHYLTFGEPSARGEPLKQYLQLVVRDHVDPLQAARRAFGDLDALSKAIESYAHRETFFHLTLPPPAPVEEFRFPSRPLSEAEVLSLRGNFLAHTRRPAESRPLLEQAAKLDPRLASPHEGLGLLAYEDKNFPEATAEFQRALDLGSTSALALYFSAQARIHGAGMTMAAVKDSVALLRKAVTLHPDFAPAHAELGSLLAAEGADLEDALRCAVRATVLEPGDTGYLIEAGSLLLRLNRVLEAREFAGRALAQAGDPEELRSAQQFLAVAERASDSLKPLPAAAATPGLAGAGDSPAEGSLDAPARFSDRAGEIQGKVTKAQCRESALSLTLRIGASSLRLEAPDYKTIEYLTDRWEPPRDFLPCRDLLGHEIRAAYRNVSPGAQEAEVSAIQVLE
jgi:Flp pilus assembly protein TadD